MKDSGDIRAGNCLNCNRSDQEAPLLMFIFNGQVRHICAQCFPVLIHKPEKLADKLPGFSVPLTDSSDTHEGQSS